MQANILKTLAGMKGGTAEEERASDEPSYRDDGPRAAEEREREKTRIRVNEFISVSELADADEGARRPRSCSSRSRKSA